MKLLGFNAFLGRNNFDVISVSEEKATVLQILPINCPRVTHGKYFYLYDPSDKTFVERTKRISDETPTNSQFHSARFALGFVSKPTQVWSVKESTKQAGQEIPFSTNVGLDIGGDDSNWEKPSNSIRRMLTVRKLDAPAVITHWWQRDETLQFRPV